MPELFIMFGGLPPGTVPQGFWTVGLVLAAIAKVVGKTAFNEASPAAPAAA